LRTELQEGITMDFKKFITDLAAIYRMPTARTPVGPIVDVDAVHEVGRKAGHEVVMPALPLPERQSLSRR